MKSLVLEWLNENALRSYPVRDSSLRTDGSFKLEDNVILDAQFVFTEIPNNFRLTTVSADSSNVTFTFSNSLTFIATKNYGANQYLRDRTGSLLVVGNGVDNIPTGTYNLSVYFEPSILHEYGGPWLGVTSLSFDGASHTGIFNFIEGYQYNIEFNKQNVDFAVGNLYGTPISCTHFSSYPEDCNTIISYISSAIPDGRHEMTIEAGPGIVVWDDPDNHRIFVCLVTWLYYLGRIGQLT